MKQLKSWWATLVLSVLCQCLSCPACEVVRIPMCQRMPYNMTRMPNLLHHSTQENAILAIEQFEELLDQNCSDVLLFFLCAMYAPICTYEFHSDAIPPCKGVCEAARTGCEPIMNKYNVSWPEGLDCTDLPLYDRGVCVSPEAIVSTLPDDRGGGGTSLGTPGAKDLVHINHKDCSCKKTPRPSRKLYRKTGFQFAIQAVPMHSLRSGENTVTRVRVIDILASGKVPVFYGSHEELWSNSTCVCPELTVNKQYLILGFEDATSGKLLYLESSIAVPWRKKYKKRVKNWAKRSKKKRRTGKRRGRKKKSRKNDKKGDKKSRGSNKDKGKDKKNHRQSGKSSRRKKQKTQTPAP